MRSLWFAGPGRLEWREVPEPRLNGDSEALVQPVIASRCAIDRLIIAGESPLTDPFPIGHEAVGRVIETGAAVTRVSVGDHVVISPSIACGHCDRCLRGRNAHCRTTPHGAAYGLPVGGNWGGLYDDLVRVPAADAMLTAIPGDTDTVTDLAEFVVAADSLGVGHEIITERLAEGRDRILVLGWAEHGLYQVAFAVAYGATEVLYVDDDPANRRLAETMGARAAPGPPDRAFGRRFDLVVATTPDPGWLRRAFHLLKPEGVVDSIGGFADPTLPAWAMYGQSTTLRVYRGNHGPDSVTATVEAIAQRRVQPSTVYSELIDWEDIPTAMTEPSRKPVAIRAGAPTRPGAAEIR